MPGHACGNQKTTFVLFCFVLDIASLHSPGCPRTYYVDQDGLELIESHLPLPSECPASVPILKVRNLRG